MQFALALIESKGYNKIKPKARARELSVLLPRDDGDDVDNNDDDDDGDDSKTS